MKYTLLLLVAALGADQKQKVNPVEKVTSLLEKIQKEIEDEGKAEAAAYDKYACFCKEQVDNKLYAITKFGEQIEVLSAKIESKTATKSQLDADISDLGKQIKEVQDDQTEADSLRKTENEEYANRDGLLSTALKRMKEAIEALEAMSAAISLKEKKAIVSKTSALIRDDLAMADAMGVTHSGKKLLSLLQGDPAAYSSHSNEVISTLEGLLKMFKQKKIEADNSEMKLRQEYEMASGARSNQIKALEKAKSEKSAQSAALEEELNAHETEKSETEYSKNADDNFMKDLTQKCEDKAKTFDQRSNTRTQELTAIAKALELLKGDVSKMYSANDLGLTQTKAKAQVPATVDDDAEDDFEEEPVSFLQLSRPETAAARKKVIAFLSHKAEALNSKVLSTLLIKMRDAPSPFAKVKQMISDLITRLEEEAAAEADQKAWCDENMQTTTAERDAAQREIEKLNALFTEKNALKDSLAEDITTLSGEIADLTKGLNEETVLRETEKDENDKTLAEAQAGLAAVQGAIDVLNDFYNPGAFIQRQKPSNTAEGYERFVAEGAGSDGKTVDDMAPDAGGVDGDYGGKKDASNSIIGMLEVIKSDFERTISQTETDETDAQGAFDTFKSETETSIGDKGTLKDTKGDEKTDAELDITQAEADLKLQKENLDNALDELEKLKPVCVDSGMSWEERTARREQEVEALKNALKILQETDFGFLQAK